MTGRGVSAGGEAPPATRNVDSTARRAFYQLARGVVMTVARLVFRLSAEDTGKLPPTGPYILAPVHRSNLDTPVLPVITRRRVRFMGKESLWRNRYAGWVLSALGGFPVERGTADRAALRTAVEILRGGEPLVMFPEGTRRSGPEVADLFDGPAYVALRTGVPIVPVGIGGSEAAMPKGARMIRPVHIHIVVGDPIPVSRAAGGRVSRREVRELTARLRDEIQVLFDRASERVGRPNRPPADRPDPPPGPGERSRP